MVHFIVRQEVFDNQASQRVQSAAQWEQPKSELLGLSGSDQIQVLATRRLKRKYLDIVLLTLSDCEAQFHVLVAQIVKQEAHVLRLLETKVNLLIWSLLDFNLQLGLHLVRVFKGTDFHETGVAKAIEPS